MFFELQLVQQLIHLLVDSLLLHAVDTSEQTDILSNCQILVKRELLRHIADMFLYLLMFGAYIIAHDPTCSASRLIQACQHVHGCRLSCAIGTQETEYLTSLY